MYKLSSYEMNCTGLASTTGGAGPGFFEAITLYIQDDYQL